MKFDLLTGSTIVVAGGNSKPTVHQETLTPAEAITRIASDVMLKEAVPDTQRFVKEAKLGQSLRINTVGVLAIIYRTE